MMDSDIYHIKTTPNFRLSRRSDDPHATDRHHHAGMVIYRDSDAMPRSPLDKRDKHDDIVCAMEEMEFNQLLSGIRRNTTANLETTASTLSRRSTIATTTPQGCPTTRKIAYMGVVADCTYVRSYGSIRLARLQIINDWNIASGVYERTFNVSLGLIYIQMSSADCPRHPKQQRYYKGNDHNQDRISGDDTANHIHFLRTIIHCICHCYYPHYCVLNKQECPGTSGNPTFIITIIVLLAVFALPPRCISYAFL
ncbi:hypothetical protein BX666DRAFT_1301101 [Dichotomocladium elegans]|nr:hypothetical protein BX666DRAFT_1301101 [Dichotomocladium elegans]